MKNIMIRNEIEVLPADEQYNNNNNEIIAGDDGSISNKQTRRLKLGWSVYETIGIGCINPRGVIAASKGSTTK